jgi:hypothetical protein
MSFESPNWFATQSIKANKTVALVLLGCACISKCPAIALKAFYRI